MENMARVSDTGKFAEANARNLMNVSSTTASNYANSTISNLISMETPFSRRQPNEPVHGCSPIAPKSNSKKALNKNSFCRLYSITQRLEGKLFSLRSLSLSPCLFKKPVAHNKK
jgi:hypothetical protein